MTGYGKDPVIGIDLGTTYPSMEIVLNVQGNRLTTSYAAFTNTHRLVGTIFDAKSGATTVLQIPFNVSAGDSGHKIEINITINQGNCQRNDIATANYEGRLSGQETENKVQRLTQPTGKRKAGAMIMKSSHHSHTEHALEHKNYKKLYECNGCKEQGFGPRYECKQCDHYLHESCMSNTGTTTHEFFPGCIFKFLDKAPGLKCRFCDACGRDIKGSVYHCKEKGWDLHPMCSKLKNILLFEGEEFWLHKNNSIKCEPCKKCSGNGGFYYKSDNKIINVCCIMKMLIEGCINGDKDNDSMTLENLKLPLKDISKKNGRGARSKVWRIMRFLLKTIASILLGDPGIILAAAAIELFM